MLLKPHILSFWKPVDHLCILPRTIFKSSIFRSVNCWCLHKLSFCCHVGFFVLSFTIFLHHFSWIPHFILPCHNARRIESHILYSMPEHRSASLLYLTFSLHFPSLHLWKTGTTLSSGLEKCPGNGSSLILGNARS